MNCWVRASVSKNKEIHIKWHIKAKLIAKHDEYPGGVVDNKEKPDFVTGLHLLSIPTIAIKQLISSCTEKLKSCAIKY